MTPHACWQRAAGSVNSDCPCTRGRPAASGVTILRNGLLELPRKRKDEEIAPAVTTLEEDVIFGRLLPYERLTEEDVMTRFGLTRHLSRRVFERLEELGVVTEDRAGGTVVRAYSLEEIEHIYEVRETLQEQAMLRMPLPAPAQLVAALREIHRRYVAAVGAADLSAIFRLNEAFHDTVFGACGNGVLAEAIKKYTWLTHGVRSRGFSDKTHLKLATQEHAQILDALARGDRRLLVTVNRTHVNRPKEAYKAAQRWMAAGVPSPPRPEVKVQPVAMAARRAKAKA